MMLFKKTDPAVEVVIVFKKSYLVNAFVFLIITYNFLT